MRQFIVRVFERWTAGEKSQATITFAIFAAPVSWLYRAVVGAAHRIKRIPLPSLTNARLIVISSPMVGGVGKTPLTAFLAKGLESRGHRMALVTLGYRRTLRGKFVMNETSGVTADEVGDEAMDLWLSTQIPVHVGDDPATAIAELDGSNQADTIVFDDGVSRSWMGERRVIVMGASDLERPIRYLPFGRWRVPPTFIRVAEYVAVTDNPAAPGFDKVQHRQRLRDFGYDGPIGWFVPRTIGVSTPSSIDEGPIPISREGQPFVFCGVANPHRFLASVKELGYIPTGVQLFDDHHRYTNTDYTSLIAQCRKSGGQWLLTSQKDVVKLDPRAFSPFRVHFVSSELVQLSGDDPFEVLGVVG